jgi:N-acyl-D-aspartate/D-glutamate deacylase
VLGHYGRGLGLFPLEKAVHKMTGLTARNFGLADRGVLKEGAFADLALFDPETVDAAASYEKPIAACARHRHGDRQRPGGVARRPRQRRAAGQGAGARGGLRTGSPPARG